MIINKGACGVVDHKTELHVGGMSSISASANNFHYFLTTHHGEEFAQMKARLGVLVYESNDEPIIHIGNCNLIEIL